MWFGFFAYLYQNCTFDTNYFLDVVNFKPEDIVYLSSESETVLHEIDPAKIYVIGALVDHNRLKVSVNGVGLPTI